MHEIFFLLDKKVSEIITVALFILNIEMFLHYILSVEHPGPAGFCTSHFKCDLYRKGDGG